MRYSTGMILRSYIFYFRQKCAYIADQWQYQLVFHPIKISKHFLFLCRVLYQHSASPKHEFIRPAKVFIDHSSPHEIRHSMAPYGWRNAFAYHCLLLFFSFGGAATNYKEKDLLFAEYLFVHTKPRTKQ